MSHNKLFLKIEKDDEVRNSFSFTFNWVTSCDMVEGSFNLLRLSSSGFTKTKANKASFLRLNQQTRQHTDLKEVLV